MIVYAPAQINSAPAQLSTAPAQPPATGAVVYTALFTIEKKNSRNVTHMGKESFGLKILDIWPILIIERRG